MTLNGTATQLFLCVDHRCPVMSDRGNEAQNLCVNRGGVYVENIIRFKGKHTLVADLTESLHEAIPIADMISLVDDAGIGREVLVALRVVFMDMQSDQSISHFNDEFLEIAAGQICMSDVKADAEMVAARLAIEQIGQAADLLGVGKSSLKNAGTLMQKQVFKTALDTGITLDHGDDTAIEFQIHFPFFLCTLALVGVDHHCGAGEILADGKGFFDHRLKIFVERLIPVIPKGIGGMDL